MVRVRDACRLVTTTYYAIKHPVLVYVNFIFLTVVWCYVVVSQFSTPTSTSTSTPTTTPSMSGHLHIRDIVARHEEQNSYNRHGSRKQYQQLATTNNQRVLLDHNTRLLHNQDTASTSYSNTPWFSDEGTPLFLLLDFV